MHDVRKAATTIYAKTIGGDEPPGTFEAIISVFGVKDMHGESVTKGAFEQSLEGNPRPPILHSHQYMTIPIGISVEMSELGPIQLRRLAKEGVPDGATGGLYGKGRLFIDGDYSVPEAKGVYRALSEGALREFSWSGRALTIRPPKSEDDDNVMHLDKVEMWEWGTALKGANPATQLVAAKAADLERLTAAAEASGDPDLKTLLKALLERLDTIVVPGKSADHDDPPTGGTTDVDSARAIDALTLNREVAA
jgi:phage head maturation protease